MPIDCEFLGGGHEVGRLAILVKTGKAKVLFDYGMSATDPPKYPAPAPPIDMMFLTHSHLDHCGMIPWVTARHDIDVIATTTSKKVGSILMEDSIKVAASEGYPEMYGKTDVKQALGRFRDIEFGDTVPVQDMQVRTHSAGHIPGATMYELVG
ncbi:MAG TPA: MBL fold metallo-hydrolase, partial [Thermoplasmata archaeon]|nr:MBL fold metallo-hydrolase [Thermoplasmata archaeon]